ncbi:MAG: fibrobacter succinogenes major paralogous domain-containing protein [Bacteroidia bacterium]|nr:fibrobacter succinogenes major paralogous domain-containing protein [Bacteroidia bacterium]
MKNKSLLMTVAILIIAMSSVAQKTGTFTDPRDGKTYKTVKIGTQTWMAENLNFKTSDSWCYDDSISNCITYGRLYRWEAAKTSCPSGWHLPNDAEWTILIDYLGGKDAAGDMLKSNRNWNTPKADITKGIGFEALPGGNYRLNATFANMGASGYWWTSSEVDNNAKMIGLEHSSSAVDRYNFNKKNGYSVRCIKN